MSLDPQTWASLAWALAGVAAAALIGLLLYHVLYRVARRLATRQSAGQQPILLSHTSSRRTHCGTERRACCR
jgi:hypothetical protein